MNTKQNIPEGETKSEKFIRVANPRIKNVIKKIRLVKQVIGSKQYDLTEEQFEAIYDALFTEVEALRSAYDGRTNNKEEIIDVL